MNSKEEEWQSTINRFIKIYPDLAGFTGDCRELLFINCLCYLSRFKRLEAKMIRRLKCLRFVDYFVPCFSPCKYNTSSPSLPRKLKFLKLLAQRGMNKKRRRKIHSIGRKVQIEVTFELITMTFHLALILNYV